MVYFGERRFKQTRSGPAASEMLRILIPILALGGLVLLIVFQVRSGGDPDAHRVHLPQAADRAPSGSSEPDPRTVDPDDPSQRPAGIVDVPPPPDHGEPDPFVANDDILLSVRDGSIDASGSIINERLPSEEAGIAYLFHRFRSELPVPVAPGLPQWPDEYTNQGDELRGRRCQLEVEILREPTFHALSPNPSGVGHYYTFFGLDSDQHYHRIAFATNDEHLGSGSRVVVTADYLRLHYYVDELGRTPAVPMWVAYEVEKAPPLEITPQWDPVVWVAAIGGFGVLVVWLTVSLHGGMKRTPTRRYSRRRTRE